MEIKRRRPRRLLPRLEGLPARAGPALAAAAFAAAAYWGVPLLRSPFVRAWASLRADPPRLDLDVKYKDFQKLAYKREEALAYGVLISGPEDYVPGWVRHGGRAWKAKLRLKGDWTDHLEGGTWSFRVRVTGGETALGMREFSLQNPKTRHYLDEWVFHRALEREDVLTTRYDFIRLSLNGKDLGVYALEDHFDKRLVERQRRREGPILKFDESVLWADRRQASPEHFRNSLGLQSFEASTIDAFGGARIRADPALFAQWKAGAGLLEGLRLGRIPASQALDVERWARFYAVCELLGAQHGAIWHNLRFYYNPITSRLEPVGYNGNAGEPIGTVLGAWRGGGFEGRAFQDAEFYRTYIRALERLSEPAYLDALLSNLGPDIEGRSDILRISFPDYRFDPAVFRRNQGVMRNALHPAKAVHAYLRDVRGGRIAIEAVGVQPMPVEVVGLSIGKAAPVAPERGPLLISGPAAPAAPDYQRISFRLPDGMRWDGKPSRVLSLLLRIPGAGSTISEAVYALPRPDMGFAAAALARRKPNARSFPFLAFDDRARVVSIRPGAWRVDRDLIVPPGWRVRAGEGTRLDLRKGASILSYSPLEWSGSEDAPVVVESSDGDGRGLAVLRAQGRSTLRRVRFKSLAAAPGLTGAVTFYESDLEASGCLFEGARAEDALHVVRSEFDISDSLFRKTSGDALDFDFARGRVLRTALTACGNDCIDASGTVLELRAVAIDGAGDKGVSVGEMSRLTAAGLRVSGARVGVASKDVSTAAIEALRLRRLRYGLAAYQKKPEFGPGLVDAKGVTMEGVEQDYLLEPGSRLAINGRGLEPNRERLRDALYERDSE